MKGNVPGEIFKEGIIYNVEIYVEENYMKVTDSENKMELLN